MVALFLDPLGFSVIFLSLFFLPLFKIHSVVLKKIVKIQRDFLWGLRSDGRKIA